MRRALCFNVYRTGPSEVAPWAWLLTNTHGDVVARSGCTYDRKEQAHRAVQEVKTNIGRAAVVEKVL